MARPTHNFRAADGKRVKDAATGEDAEMSALRALCKNGAFPHVLKLIGYTLRHGAHSSPRAVVMGMFHGTRRLTLQDFERFRDAPDAPYVDGKIDPVLEHICKVVSFIHPIQQKAMVEAAAAENARRQAERAGQPAPYTSVSSLVDKEAVRPTRRRPALDDGQPIVGIDGKLIS